MSAIRVALCVPPGAEAAGIERTLAELEDFEVVVTTQGTEELIAQCEVLCPDMAVLDESLARSDLERVLTVAGNGRPLPTLLLVDDERPISPEQRTRERRAGLSRVARRMVSRSDDLARGHVRTKLHLTAASVQRSATRITQTPDEIASAMEEVRRRASRVRVRDSVAELAAWPLDLITLVGSAEALPALEQLVDQITSVPVPILVAVSGVNASRLATLLSRAPGVEIRSITDTIPLRQAHGILIVGTHQSVRVEPDMLRTSPGATDLLQLIASMAELRSGGLTVLLSQEAELLDGLPTIAAGGGLSASLGPAVAERPQGPQPAKIDLTVDELAWLLSRAVPRRT